MKSIVAHVRIKGGRHLSAKNANRIVVRSTRPSDKMGNRFPSPLYKHKNDPPYFQKWTIKREQQGYIFREVNHGGGLCGFHKTVRGLVGSVLLMSQFGSSDKVVEVET